MYAILYISNGRLSTITAQAPNPSINTDWRDEVAPASDVIR